MLSAADSLRSPDAALAVDAKTDLNQFCQRYCKRPVTKQDIVYEVNRFGRQYQAIVKLNCFSGQEYAGHLSMCAKEAEKSAAHQALVAYAQTIEGLGPKEEVHKSKKKVPLTATEIAAKKIRQNSEAGLNPAITPKTKLNSLCMKISKRYLQKGDTVYESQKVSGGYQATVQLFALPGDWVGRCWAGEVCSTKQKAEQSAAEIAMQQVLADSTLNEEAQKPKGKGKGSRSGSRGEFGYWTYTGRWLASGPDQPRTRVSDAPIRGEVIEWKDNYGWVRAHASIEHPAASRRDGRIYVSKQDLSNSVDSLAVGATVRFILYEDPSGLGGEDVSVV